MSFHKI